MMFKFKIFTFFLFTATALFSNTSQLLPKIIDFGKFPPIEDNKRTYDPLQFELGCYAFNIAPELTPMFAFLAQKYHIDVAVETGTLQGSTAIGFSRLFGQVHTIEIVPDLYNAAKEKFSDIPNIHCYLGSSEKVLQDILPSLAGQRVLFYLDAHWEAFWPLLDELEAISQTHRDNCIIVIDDFKVPGRKDIYYDFYGSAECSYEYVKGKLERVFSGYTIHYLIPKSTWSRAKFIAIPTHWAR